MANFTQDKTTEGEPTFGLPNYQPAIVQDRTGMQTVAYHDNDTWYEGHYNEERSDGSIIAPVQLLHVPVKLIRTVRQSGKAA